MPSEAQAYTTFIRILSEYVSHHGPNTTCNYKKKTHEWVDFLQQTIFFVMFMSFCDVYEFFFDNLISLYDKDYAWSKALRRVPKL